MKFYFKPQTIRVKKVVYIYIFYFITIIYGDPSLFTDIPYSVKKIHSNLLHANTYYFYGRFRSNSLYEFEKSTTYARSVISLIDSEIISNPALESYLLPLQSEAQTILKHSSIQRDICIDNMNNRFPLYSELMGLSNEYVFYDDPSELALEGALQQLLVLRFPRSTPLSEQMFFSILVNDPRDPNMEEISHQFINNNSKHYIIAPHELTAYLDKIEHEELYNNNFTISVLNKITESLDLKQLGIFTTNKIDGINGIYYYGANFKLFNKEENGIVDEISNEGFVNDKRKEWHFGILFFLLIGIITFILMGFIRFILFKRQKETPTNFLSLTTAYVIGTIVVFILLKIAAIVSPDLSEYYLAPNSIIWRLFISSVLGIIPIILNYIIFARVSFFRSTLNNSDSIAAITIGSLLSSITVLGYFSIIRFGITSYLWPFYISILPIVIVGLLIGKSVHKAFIYSKSDSKIQVVIYLLACYLLFYKIIEFWDISNSLWSLLLISIIVLVGLIIPLFVSTINKIGTTKKVDPETDYTLSIESLKKNLLNPMYINPPNNTLDRCVEFILLEESNNLNTTSSIESDSDGKLKVILVKASQGCGKTRFANEVSKKITTELGERVQVLFGDCNEFHDGESIPYEPFAEAVGQFLGVNRFQDPAHKAKILNKTLRTGLELILDQGGLGALASLLDSKELENPKATINEMAHVVKQFLANFIQKEKKNVLFIIDDLQWIDSTSFVLFQRLFENIFSSLQHRNQLSFLLTNRPDDKEIESSAVTFIRKYGQSGEINLLEIDEVDLSNSLFLEELLENLNFEYSFQKKLKGLFADSGINNPFNILQTLKTISDNDWIKTIHGKYALRKEVNLAFLPPPDDIRKMIREQLGNLDDRLLRILQCAAFIGYSFEANILAEVMNFDRLELLHLLKEAEDNLIVVDVRETDDVYKFNSKSVVAELRLMLAGGENNGYSEESVSQIVKEYYLRIVDALERNLKRNGDDLETVDLSIITSIAKRSMQISDIAGDKSIDLNLIAAKRCFEAQRIEETCDYYENVLTLLRKHYPENKEKILDITVKLTQLYIDRGMLDPTEDFAGKSARMLINQVSNEFIFQNVPQNDSNNNKSDWIIKYAPLSIDFQLLESLYYYRKKKFEESKNICLDILSLDYTTEYQQLRAQFYVALCLPRNSKNNLQKAANNMEEVLEKIENKINKNIDNSTVVDYKRLKGEVLNTLGGIYADNLFPASRDHSDFEKALLFLHKRISMEESKKQFYFDILRERGKLEEHLVNSNITNYDDKQGLAFTYNYLGRLYLTDEQYDLAEIILSKALHLCEIVGDKGGIAISSSKLGEIMLLNSNWREANKYYNQSFMESKISGNPVGQGFAILGLLRTSVLSNDVNNQHFTCGLLTELIRSIGIKIKTVPHFLIEELRNELEKCSVDETIKLVQLLS